MDGWQSGYCMSLLNSRPSGRIGSNPIPSAKFGHVAQRIEHGASTSMVGGSIPSVVTR